jgi:flagellum-specific ATP synthase
MRDIVSADHQKMAGKVREILATYREAEDLINIGAYVAGSNAKIDYAIARIEVITDFLCQGMNEAFTLEDTLAEMELLAQDRRS